MSQSFAVLLIIYKIEGWQTKVRERHLVVWLALSLRMGTIRENEWIMKECCKGLVHYADSHFSWTEPLNMYMDGLERKELFESYYFDLSQKCCRPFLALVVVHVVYQPSSLEANYSVLALECAKDNRDFDLSLMAAYGGVIFFEFGNILLSWLTRYCFYAF